MSLMRLKIFLVVKASDVTNNTTKMCICLKLLHTHKAHVVVHCLMLCVFEVGNVENHTSKIGSEIERTYDGGPGGED